MFYLEEDMKRKPDTMMTVIGLFVIGLIVSGFSSLSVGADENAQKNAQAEVRFDRSVSRY
jgi:hypothetical protein